MKPEEPLLFADKSMCELHGYMQRFRDYVEPFRTGSELDIQHIDLKYDHSLRVMHEAIRILETLSVSEEFALLSRVAALYHDIGRFTQYSRFKTFKDSQSLNHAVLGVSVLKKTQLLDLFDKRQRQLILTSITMHNKKDVPELPSSDHVMMAKLVRDADKLDIVKVMIDHLRPGKEKSNVVVLGAKDEPERYTELLVEQIKSGRIGDYTCLNYINDFKLLIMSWVYDLNFSESCRLFYQRGYLDYLVELLPDTAELRHLKSKVEEDLLQRIEPTLSDFNNEFFTN